MPEVLPYQNRSDTKRERRDPVREQLRSSFEITVLVVCGALVLLALKVLLV